MSAPHSPFDRDHLPPGVDPPAKGDPRDVGEYRIVGRIGTGGMGAVYAGVGPQGGCAAVKVIHPQFAADPEFLARFAREVELVSRVRATCTAAFHGADVRAATPWLATEYVRGRTLRQHVQENGPLNGGVLVALAVGLAEALTAIHEAGVIHRDLKPGNVILSPEGPKVLDFGIARAIDATALTQTGGLVGTPGWIAPEQFLGADATERSDMFAWGGMVAFAATGRNPFGTGNAEALVHRTRTEEPDLDGIPEELAALVRRAMDKEPGRRPTAEQVLVELIGDRTATRVGAADQVPPTRLVPEFLATEWCGVTAPDARRVRRPRRGLLAATAVASTAGVLVLALLAAWLLDLPGSGAGADGQEEAGTGGSMGEDAADPADAADAADPETEIPVEDGPAMLARAVDLALGASSFDTYSLTFSGPPSAYPRRYRYSESPQPLYLYTRWSGPMLGEVLEIGDRPDDVIHRVISVDSLALGLEDGGYFRDPDGTAEYDGPLDRGVLVEELAWIADEGVVVDYLGESALPENSDAMLEGAADLGRIAGATGHQYSGSFDRDFAYEFEVTSPGEYGYTFDVWLDEDGYPLLHQLFYEPVGDAMGQTSTRTVTYLSFNEPVDIEVPDESEIAASREEMDGAGT
ncbi:serine/threonine protein kinase [Nocardiopsis sp. Huas11]|uniref:serine/threonine-protein kinase n=1 Tax=Nocardiopsis sp. Huas11 TaxID=2183912 RepID=UPI000EAE2EC7|nr:serine/threonine-protein kinase [Nocardiopsis sp. Huas11]RKS05529.1 serine/threonine protein kinase [Nocardiopsis sp. Huas11]